MIKKTNLLQLLTRIPALIIFIGLVAPNNARGQSVSVSASLDSTLMVIGGQMNYTLLLTQPAGVQVQFPVLIDTLTSKILIVTASKPDTVFRDNNLLNISRVYRITSFDSGLHYVPPVAFEYAVGEMKRVERSNPLALMVVNPFQAVDPEKGLFDIKPPINTPFRLSELLRFLHWFLLLVLVVALSVVAIHWWRKRINPVKSFLFKEKPKEPPHIVALRELERIKNEKPWQKGYNKLFYSQLTGVLRKYMEERFQFAAMEQTTNEILDSLKGVDLPDPKLLPKMKLVLETADLAKFAKYQPQPDENDMCLLSSFFFVNQTKLEEKKTPEEAAKESVQREKEESMQH